MHERVQITRFFHLNDAGEVEGHCDVGKREHIASHQLQELKKLDEIYVPGTCVAEGHHLGHRAPRQQMHEPAVNRDVTKKGRKARWTDVVVVVAVFKEREATVSFHMGFFLRCMMYDADAADDGWVTKHTHISSTRLAFSGRPVLTCMFLPVFPYLHSTILACFCRRQSSKRQLGGGGVHLSKMRGCTYGVYGVLHRIAYRTYRVLSKNSR